jgi:hypothetical protein
VTDWKPVVARVTQSALPTQNGRITTSFAVQFNVGPHGPFTQQIAAEEFTADKVKAMLESFAATINALPQDQPLAPATS